MTLSPVVSRALAVALALMVIGAVYRFAVAPVLDAHRAHAETIEQARDQIARFGRVGATRPALEARLAALEKRSSTSRGYLRAKSATLAAAQLQNRVKQTVTRQGGSIRSLQTLPSQNERNLERVAIRVQLTARIDQLQKIFHAFENGATYLFLDDVNIRVQRARRSRRGRKAAPTVDERLLTVRLNLYGFVRREAS